MHSGELYLPNKEYGSEELPRFFKDKDVMKSEEKRIGPNEIKFKKSCQRCILMRLMSEAITMRFVKEMSTKMF